MFFEFIGLLECPYMKRLVRHFWHFSIRLHYWYKGDDKRHFHDHSWWFLLIVLKGGYTDISESGKDVLRIGSIRFRNANYKHTVQDVIPRTWTFLITGKPSRRWGFWVGNKLIKRDKYFAVYGHHPCNDGEYPVRIKPNRTKI
jgi:hypothetical protein